MHCIISYKILNVFCKVITKVVRAVLLYPGFELAQLVKMLWGVTLHIIIFIINTLWPGGVRWSSIHSRLNEPTDRRMFSGCAVKQTMRPSAVMQTIRRQWCAMKQSRFARWSSLANTLPPCYWSICRSVIKEVRWPVSKEQFVGWFYSLFYPVAARWPLHFSEPSSSSTTGPFARPIPSSSRVSEVNPPPAMSSASGSVQGTPRWQIKCSREGKFASKYCILIYS